MTDGEMDKWAFSEEDITDRPTSGDMFDIGYEMDETEDHPLSRFKADGYSAREERNKAIYSILEGMSEDEKQKYSFLPDREALRSVSSFPADKVFYDFDKIAIDNGFMTDEEINDIDIKKSSELRMEMAEMQRKGGSNTMAFLGSMASQLNPFNAPENFIPIFGVTRVASILKQSLRYGAENATLQAGIEPAIHDWKQQIKSPYDTGDSINNIIFSAGIGAGLGGLIGGVKALIKSKKLSPTDEKIVKDFVEEVETNPFVTTKNKENGIVDVDGLTQEQAIREAEDFQTKVNEGAMRLTDVPDFFPAGFNLLNPDIKAKTPEYRVELIRKNNEARTKQLQEQEANKNNKDKQPQDKENNRPKIDDERIIELKTIVDGKVVPLEKVVDDLNVEIDTYKNLRDCVL